MQFLQKHMELKIILLTDKMYYTALVIIEKHT